MKTNSLSKACPAAAVMLAALGISSAYAQEAALQKPAAGIEVLTRGIVHEAFAQPNDLKPEPGLPVPKAPPSPIPEEPPDQRPEGENIQWMGGYWAWDADRNDFVWVSGAFRNAPAGRQFVPGHWVHTEDGWVWIPGFWAPLNQGEMPYVPEPPAPLEVDPALPPPNDASYYVPGYWAFRDNRFVWRPGYYAPFRAGRIWVSPRYIWTPGGFLFVDGYWDTPLEDRGLLFAPVYFSQPLWRDAGWVYRPGFVVGTNLLLDALFVRSRSHHFYFGNYYGNAHARAGFHPWFAGTGRADPMFTYYRLHNRGNRNWVDGMQQTFADRSAGRIAVPPTTFGQQGKAAGAIRVVTPLSQFQGDKVRLVKTAPAQLESARLAAQRGRELSLARGKVETSKTVAAGTQKTGEFRTLKLNSENSLRGAGQPKVTLRDSGAKKVEIQGGHSTPSMPKVLDAPRTSSKVIESTKPAPRLNEAPKIAPQGNPGRILSNQPKGASVPLKASGGPKVSTSNSSSVNRARIPAQPSRQPSVSGSNRSGAPHATRGGNGSRGGAGGGSKRK